MPDVIEYADGGDPVGRLVYDGDLARIAAGGCRVQPGLDAEALAGLAARTGRKQRLLGLHVDGAACGMESPAALGGFLDHLRTEISDRLVLGPDLGTRWHELSALAAERGAGSLKQAVRDAQGLAEDDFADRLRLLDVAAGPLTPASRGAGHALAHAGLAATEHLGLRARGLKVAVQGFGTLGRSAALSLAEAGAAVTAISDEHGCIADPNGLDLPRMLSRPDGRPVGQLPVGRLRLGREHLFDLPVDLLVLAAGADALTDDQVPLLQAPVVAVGADAGLRPAAEAALASRGVLVLPDFVAGCGGPASMNALFGGPATDPGRLRADIVATVRNMVEEVLAEARRRRVSPRRVATDLADAFTPGDDRPYGASPYLVQRRDSRRRPAVRPEAA